MSHIDVAGQMAEIVWPAPTLASGESEARVPLFKKVFGKKRAVLAGDTGDQRTPHAA
jgi:hypothetical protein